MLRVFEDPDDRLDAVVQINGLADRQAGVIVGHAPPRGFDEALPQDLLAALGHDRGASHWPRTAAPAWRLTRAWMAGFEIRHLVIYGAWRVTDKLARTLLDIDADDGIDVSLVNLVTMRQSLPPTLDALNVEPVSVLIDEETAGPRNARAIAAAPGCLPTGLPPLPPADMTRFKAECKGSIEDQELWIRFRQAFDSLIESAASDLADVDRADRVLELLEDEMRRARNGNELLARTRAFQIAALGSGWHVRVPLRGVAVAIAMALNTAPDNHSDWPLAADTSPQTQGLAALALTTRGSVAAISAVRIGDVDAQCATVREQRIEPALRPAIRAQLWLQRHLGRGDEDPLFSTKNGLPLRPAAIRRALDAAVPEAFNTAELGPDTVGHSLAELVHVIRVAVDRDQFECDEEATRSLLPKARYWDWAFAHGGCDLHGATGLPDAGSGNMLRAERRGFAIAIEAATGYSNPPPWPSSYRTAAVRNCRVEEYLIADAARLHSVLLQTGGGADRLSLIHGLRWSAERLETAEHNLREQLSRTAEILAATLEGRLELRVRSDAETMPAVEKILQRGDRDNGLSPAGARLLLELLDGPPRGIPINEIQMRPDIARAAIDELRHRRLIYVAEQALVGLLGGVRSNLWGEERDFLWGTDWDLFYADARSVQDGPEVDSV